MADQLGSLQDNQKNSHKIVDDGGTDRVAVRVAVVETVGGGGGGSGTEYTEGAADASINGTAVLMEGAADTLVPLQGTIANGLLVNLGANNDVTVASLPLPAGAATLAAQLQDNHQVTVSNTVGVTGPLTDAQLRATPVPISGTVTTTGVVDQIDTSVTAEIQAISDASEVRCSADVTNNLANRKYLSVQNVGAVDLYLGETGVLADGTKTAFVIKPNDKVILAITDAVDMYIIAASGGGTAQIAEWI